MASDSIVDIRWNYTHNDFEFCAPVETLENFFRNEEVNRHKLAAYFEELARKCRLGDYPFRMIGT